MERQHHWVTGCASGIGFALARHLLRRGDAVLACDVNLEPMRALAEFATSPDGLQMRTLDVRDPAQWRQTADEMRAAWPRLDSLCNVAGVLKPEYVHDISAADIDWQIDVNVKGTMHGTQAALRWMREQRDAGRGRGHIVNLCSMAGLSPVPGSAIYSASKFAVRGYSLSIAAELRPLGIAVSIVCPDAVATPMLAPQARREQAALIFSGGRMLTPERIAALIADDVMRRRPLEATLPQHRGVLCKLSSLSPRLAMPLMGAFTRRGLRKQQAGLSINR